MKLSRVSMCGGKSETGEKGRYFVASLLLEMLRWRG